MNLKKYLKFRVLFLLFWIIMSIIAINPKFGADGVAVKSVEKNSSAGNAGITFDPNAKLTSREIILQINNQDVKNLEDYSKIIESINETNIVRIKTNKQEYAMLKQNNLGLSVENVQKSNVKRGLDLQGGTRVILQPKEKLTEQEIKDLISS